MMQYYVIQVYSGYEDKTKKELEEYIHNSGLQQYFGNILIPSKQTKVDNRTKIERFYPGYIFLQMEKNEKTLGLLNQLKKTKKFIEKPISDNELKKVLDVAETGAYLSSEDYSIGDKIRIVEGPFQNFFGNVEEVKLNQKVRARISIFGRDTSVVLNYNQIEKVL